MALPLPVYIVVNALSLEDRHGQNLIHSDYSILLDLVNQYHSTPIIHMPLQLSIRQVVPRRRRDEVCWQSWGKSVWQNNGFIMFARKQP
jgi:hypothetical protein